MACCQFGKSLMFSSNSGTSRRRREVSGAGGGEEREPDGVVGEAGSRRGAGGHAQLAQAGAAL